MVASKQIASDAFPDQELACGADTFELILSPSHCNVFYDCMRRRGDNGDQPADAFYCLDGGHFDNVLKVCRPASAVACAHFNPQAIYPLIAIAETDLPETGEMCSSASSMSARFSPFVMASQHFVNVFYACNGRSSTPSVAFRCYDIELLDDGIFNATTQRCAPKASFYQNHQQQAAPMNKQASIGEIGNGNGLTGTFLNAKVRYQSMPVENAELLTLVEMDPLSCQPDQQVRYTVLTFFHASFS